MAMISTIQTHPFSESKRIVRPRLTNSKTNPSSTPSPSIHKQIKPSSRSREREGEEEKGPNPISFEEEEEIGFMGTELLHPHDYLSPKARSRTELEKRRRGGGGGSGSSRRLFIGHVTILKRGESLNEKVKDDDEYAGSAFAMSPSPRSLPLPRFRRKDAFVDLSATQGLRRLLRLD